MFTAIVKWLQYFPTLLTPKAEICFFQYQGIAVNILIFFSVCVHLSTGLWFNNVISVFCANGPVTW